MRTDYQPGKARVGEHTPQTHPEEFSDEDIAAEVKYLMATNRRFGSHPLRTMAYLDLLKILKVRTVEVGK